MLFCVLWFCPLLLSDAAVVQPSGCFSYDSVHGVVSAGKLNFGEVVVYNEVVSFKFLQILPDVIIASPYAPNLNFFEF